MVRVRTPSGEYMDIAAKITGDAPSLAQLCAQSGIKFAPRSKMFYFKFAREVSEFKAAVAEGTAAECARDLELRSVQLRWVVPGTPADHDIKGTPGDDYHELRAFVRDDAMYLDVGMELDDLKAAIRHECRHLYHRMWEVKHGVARPSRDKEEEDCCNYARSVRRWGAQGR